MEDLDKKLDAVINDLERLTLTLGSLLGSDNETYIEQIKQAFLDKVIKVLERADHVDVITKDWCGSSERIRRGMHPCNL